MDISSIALQAVAAQKSQLNNSISNAITKQNFKAEKEFANLIAETVQALQDAGSAPAPGLGKVVDTKA